MLILAVDTTSSRGSLAVLREARLMGVISTESDEGHSSRLFRQFEFLRTELAFEAREFDLYAVASGPGSFTGLRVGLAAVKAWAEVYAKPVAAVSALEAIAAQATSPVPLLAPVADAHRGQVFGGLYERLGDELVRRADDVVMTLEEFLREVEAVRGRRAVGYVTVAGDPVLDRLGANAPLKEGPAGRAGTGSERVESVSPVLAPAVGQLGWQRARRGELVDALTLDAHYVRRSDAEIKWKE